MLKSLVSRSLLCCVAFAGLGISGVSVSAEDLTIVSQVSSGQGKATTSTQFLTTDKVRTSDGRHDTIFDIESGRIIQIDHKKKKYAETDLEEMRRQFAEIEKMVKDTPMLASMFGKATEVTVEKGSGSRSYAGYECSQYFLTMGKLEFEVWSTPDLVPPEQYFDAKKMAYAAMGPSASSFEKIYDAMKEIEGYPLYTKFSSRIMGMNIDGVSEATEVRVGPIPAETFEPPKGYKKKKSAYK